VRRALESNSVWRGALIEEGDDTKDEIGPEEVSTKKKTVNGHLETQRLKPRAGDDKMFAQEFNMAAVIAGANNEGGKEGTGEAKDSEVAAGTDGAKVAWTAWITVARNAGKGCEPDERKKPQPRTRILT